MLRAARLLTFGAVAAGVLAISSAPASEAAGPIRTTATWRFCTDCAASGGDLSRYGYVGQNAWNADRVPAIHAGGGKALVYKDMASTRSESCGGVVPAGVDHCWASENRPEWFALDGDGRRIEWSGWPGHWQMRVGDPRYQDRWAGNVIAELEANGWDGVVIDNANADQRGYLAGRTMRDYPTQAAYRDATRSFLAHVCPRVIAAGFLCLPNIQANPVLAAAELWADWTQFTSGGVREYWMKWGSGSGGAYGDGGWDELMTLAETAQRGDKIFLAVTYAPMSDVRSIRWARANFLLGWSGGPSAFVFAPAPEAQDPWSPEWTTEIGAPVGPRFQSGGVLRRNFTDGVVLVNRSSAAVSVELGAALALPDGTRVERVSLEPLSGVVLVGSAPAAPRPAEGVRLTLTAAAVQSERTPAIAARTIRVRGRLAVPGALAADLARASRSGERAVTLLGLTPQGWERLASLRTDALGRFDVVRSARVARVRAVGLVASTVVRSPAVRVRAGSR